MAYMLEWVTKMAQSYTSTIWDPISFGKQRSEQSEPHQIEKEWERLVRDLFLFALFKGLSGRILVVSGVGGRIYFGKKGLL